MNNYKFQFLMDGMICIEIIPGANKIMAEEAFYAVMREDWSKIQILSITIE